MDARRRRRRATSSITRRQSTRTARCASSTSATASAAGPTTGSLELFAMKFYPVQDELNIGYVLNPEGLLQGGRRLSGPGLHVLRHTGRPVRHHGDDRAVQTTGAAVTLTAASVEGKVYTYTVPMAALSGQTSLKLTASAKNSFGMTYSGETTVQVLDEPVLTNVMPAANEATGANKRPGDRRSRRQPRRKPDVLHEAQRRERHARSEGRQAHLHPGEGSGRRQVRRRAERDPQGRQEGRKDLVVLCRRIRPQPVFRPDALPHRRVFRRCWHARGRL